MAPDIASFAIRPKPEAGAQRLPIRLGMKRRTLPNAKSYVLPNGRIIVIDHDTFVANVKASVAAQANLAR